MKKLQKFRHLSHARQNRLLVAGIAVFGIGALGFTMLDRSQAATYATASEVETAALAGNAFKQDTSGASGNLAVNFGGVSNAVPTITATTLVSGLNKPWDVQFLPDGSMIYDQKLNSQVHIYRNGASKLLYTFNDVRAPGPANEGGLLGIAVDPDYATTRDVYFCYTGASDLRVVRLTLNSDATAVVAKNNVITGIPTNNGSGGVNTRHSGGRIAFGPDKSLFITVGDGALPGVLAQNMNSLAGKILRINKNGSGVAGNMTGGDSRIFSQGIRNPQGLAFFPSPRNGLIGVSATHGSSTDDELNPLTTGNFGWAPNNNPYDESSTPATDLNRFPNAVRAIWSSGSPTMEPSGICILNGPQWGAYNGQIGMAMQKSKQLRLMKLDGNNKLSAQTPLYNGTYGRLRTCTQGPDGNLYIATDNGSDDKIIRLTPKL